MASLSVHPNSRGGWAIALTIRYLHWGVFHDIGNLVGFEKSGYLEGERR